MNLKLDHDRIAYYHALARRERAKEVHRLIIAPLMRFFTEPPKRPGSRMLRRHTAFG